MLAPANGGVAALHLELGQSERVTAQESTAAALLVRLIRIGGVVAAAVAPRRPGVAGGDIGAVVPKQHQELLLQ
jgi:hypothetical protein